MCKFLISKGADVNATEPLWPCPLREKVIGCVILQVAEVFPSKITIIFLYYLST
jgi:hypothetical protein